MVLQEETHRGNPSGILGSLASEILAPANKLNVQYLPEFERTIKFLYTARIQTRAH
jgi:hypothetical protein